MIIPRHWAEARIQQRVKGRQVTVRRFGWSQASFPEAEAHAESRAKEAMARLLAGENLPRRERKVPYNGADGLPIREEIVEEHGPVVITRNSYGALCLNTPDVLFADVDCDPPESATRGCLAAVVLIAAGIWSGLTAGGWLLGTGLIVAGLALLVWLNRRDQEQRLTRKAELIEAAGERIRDFASSHPAWRLRTYRTPAGYRVLVMHRTFAPDDSAVGALFDSLQADPLYVRMCQRQQCFRARVSPKPWRIGMNTRLGPRPVIWPVKPEKLSSRKKWVAEYEEKSRAFAACSFEEELGSGDVNASARSVQQLHDRLCRAQAGLPIA